MERIVYCQDNLYINDLKSVNGEYCNKVSNRKESQVGSGLQQEPYFVRELVSHTKAYFYVSLQMVCTLNAIYPLSRSDCS